MNAHRWRENLASVINIGLIGVLLVTMSYLATQEPVVYDGWGAYRHVRAAGDDFIAALGNYTYQRGNPRLGHLFFPFLYFSFPVHALLTPLFYLALWTEIVALALGRLPSWRSFSDISLLFSASALGWLFIPTVGSVFFYRPAVSNYFYGLVITLVPFVILRCGRSWTDSGRRPLVALLVMTAAAGMCNEHTGPVAIAALVALLLAAGLRGQGLVPAYLTSLVGLTAGFLALLFAPGQSIRYRGLAERQPIFDNLLHRWPENLDVLIRGLWPITEIVLTGLSVWLIFTMLRRVIRVRAIEEGGRPSQSDPSPQIAILALACAIAGVVVILASPLTPNRMIFAPVTISIVAAVWLFERAIVWRPGAFMLMAGSLAINGWVLGQAVDLYSDLGPEDRARLEILESTPDGEMAVVPVFSRPEPSRIFWGDDLRNSRGRAYARSRAFPHLLGIETIQDAGTRFSPAKLLVAKRGIDPVLRRCRAMGSAIPSLPGSRPIPYESMLRLWQPLQDCYAGFESQAAMVSVILRTEGSIFSYTMGTLEINVGRLDRVLSRAYRLEPRSEVGHSYEIIRLQEQTDRVYVHSTTSMEHHLISSGVFSPWRPGGYVLFSCAKNHPGQCRFIDYVEMHGGDARESDMTIRSRL